jgi:hypothetical protein
VTDPGILADGITAFHFSPARADDMWRQRPATVVIGGRTSIIIRFDEEGFNGEPVVNVPAVLLSGTAAPGDRVMVQSVPPNLNYVVSNVSQSPGPARETFYGAVDVQSYNDDVFHDILVGGVAATLPFTKYYTSSRINVNFTLSGFVTAPLTGIRGAVNVSGVDYDASQLFYNATVVLTHLPQAATMMISDVSAGTYDVVMRVRRYAGAGIIQFDDNDLLTCTLTEST